MNRSTASAIAAGTAISAACGILYAWSVFVLPLEQAMGWSRQSLSLTFTIVFACFSAGMFSGGILIRRAGPRITVLVGSAILCAGFLLASKATSPLMLHAGYGVLAGLGMGIVDIVPATVCLRLLPEYKGAVGGLLTMALAAGTLLFGSIAAPAIITGLGVFGTFRILAFVIPMITAVSALFLHDVDRADSGAVTASEEGLTLGQTLRTGSYRLLWLWTFLIQTGGLMVVGHLVPIAGGAGFSIEAASILLGAHAAANGLGRIVFGVLYDRLGARAAMRLDSIVLAAGLSLIIAGSGASLAAVLAAGVICVGLAYGGCIPMLAATCMSLFGPAHFGTIYGFSTTPSVAAGISGPFLAGMLFTESGSYLTPLAVSLTLATVTFPVLLMLFRRRAY